MDSTVSRPTADSCQRFRFADLTLDLGQRRLVRGKEAVSVKGLSFELLRALVEAAPNLVTHETLAREVWGSNRVVTQENIAKRAVLLRQALGDSADMPRYVEAVRGQGYRLLSKVERVAPEGWSEAEPRAVRGGRKSLLPVAVTALMIAVVLGGVLYGALHRAGLGEPAVVRFEILPTADAPFVLSPYARDVAISDDGTRVAYRSNDQSLIVRALDSLEPTRLAGLGGDLRNASFSPDGRYLAYLDGSVLKRLSLAGAGDERTLAEVGQFTDGDIHWEDDDTILIANSIGIHRIPADGGNLELLATPDTAGGERAFNAPSMLPGRNALLFSIEPTRADAGSRIAVLDLDTGGKKFLIDGGTQPIYVTTGHLVFAADYELRAVRFDIDRLEVGTEQATFVQDLMVRTNGASNLGVSRNGTLIYATGATRQQKSLVWVGLDGSEEVLNVPPMNFTYPRLSPDGRRIAIDARWPDSDIWVWDIERELATRVTNDPAENALPVWYPNGRKLAFGDGRSGATNIYVSEVDTGRAAEPLMPTDRRQLPFSISPDGRYLLFGESQPNGAWRMNVYDSQNHEQWPLTGGSSAELNTDFSPDGRWVVFQSNESGNTEIYVRSFPDTAAGRWQISRAGGSKPMWSKDGKRIFYINPDLQLMAVDVWLNPEFSAGQARQVLDLTRYTSAAYGAGARPYDLSLDGNRILIPRDPDAEIGLGDTHIVVTVNWTQELLDRLPVTD